MSSMITRSMTSGADFRLDFDLADPDLRRAAYGDCHFLTVALAQATGWQPVVLHDLRYRSNLTYLHDYGEPLHSAVLTPRGLVLDAHGVRSLGIDEIAEHYGDKDSIAWRPDAEPSLEDMSAVLPPDPGDRPEQAAVLARRILAAIEPFMDRIGTAPEDDPSP